MEATEQGPLWMFYEGPPTANGMPGTHHVEARVFKDVFPRYRTMKGYHVPRQAGWDCHGLPVELAVEKELGFTGKPDIENYGIAEFNAACRENVQRHVDAFLAMSERMGYWADYEHAYWTMTPDYVESVWWALKTIYDKGLLVEDFRVAPYCPRCGTGLSDHEVAQGYEDVTDPSVYVRFPVASGPLADRHPGVALLVWTTTPWTLVSNTASAVNPEVDYVVARTGAGEVLVVAEALHTRVLGEDSEVLETLPGSELVGTPYVRPFDMVDFGDADGVHRVLAADFVTTDDGSGVVHEAPAFGAEDFALCKANGLPIVNPVTADGRFDEGLALVGGVFFKDADPMLVADLDERGLLFRHVPYEHSYPHCWRCHTPLMYYALPSWYIRTTAIKDELLAQNQATNWYPETIKNGRYGDWLRTTSTGPCRAIATGVPRCRCGATTPTRPGRSASGRWPSCGSCPAWSSTTRTAPTSTTSPSPSTVRRAPTGGCRRSSTPGSTRGPCRSPSSERPTATPTRPTPPTRPISSARPSTRPAAGSTR